ncbi:MAG TPA: exonuclease SbcCD subunit D C-terminal domain-containing protein [Kofleriaceae bacterium]|nr:exonuclease SbcCD subunit D C-terminal domain-containing protein [Kofleriaceae bacterium]
MRLLHTSDWHLGHLLHDLPREREHAAFLAWLLDVVEAERIDGLLVTGDVFDSGNPPASAQAAWFGFLADAHRRRPGMTIVAIAGNHDSPSRMVAPAPLYAGVRAHVVGALPRAGAGSIDVERLLVPIEGADGEVGAWAVAVPFLRPFDLDGEPAEATREVYRQALAAARARRRPGQAIVAMGHLHLTRGEVSPGSERRLAAAGGLEAIDGQLGELFAGVAYVALGHLHKAQRVGREHVRYAGSPIPLAMGEAEYRHQVAIVELEGGEVSGIRTLPVPRTVELVRVPRRGAAPLADVLRELAVLPEAIDGEEPDARPFLEVRVRLAGPTPHLRAQIEEATRGKRPRLVKITSEAAGDGRALAEALPAEVLAELDPREVLRRRWRRQHDGELPAPVLAAFERLLAEVEASS